MKKPIQESIQEAVQKAWSEAVGALQGVEQEVGRRVRQAIDRADLPANSEEAQRVLADFGKRLQQNTEAVGQRIEESARTALARFRDPLLEEISRLRVRAEELSRRVEKHVRGKGEPSDDDSGQPPPG